MEDDGKTNDIGDDASSDDIPIYLGEEAPFFEKEYYMTKIDVNPYDIFKLAKGILIVAASIYVLFALIRIFYNDGSSENSGVKEVWEYSKVVLNSIVSLVLGLYFGSKQDAKNSK